VAGRFQWAGNSRAYGLASWKNGKWFAVGENSQQSQLDLIHTLASDAQGALMIGGEFAQVRSVQAFNVARWIPPNQVIGDMLESDQPERITSDLSVYPNPLREGGTLRVIIPATAIVDIRVYDLLGREQGHVFSGALQAGQVYDFPLNLTGSGVYFVHVLSEGTVQTHSFVNTP